MIDRAATEQLIISKVAMITKKDPASITRDTRLQADLDMKSIDYHFVPTVLRYYEGCVLSINAIQNLI